MSIIGDALINADMARTEHMKIRDDIYMYDRSLIKNRGLKIGFEDIANISDGTFVLSYNDVNYECFIHNKKQTKRLYVVLSGAKSVGSDLPIHKRWSYYRIMNGTLLSIADPMLREYRELTLGWYYGDRNKCYVKEIVDIVHIFANELMKDEVIFLGSSGGGYAAAFAACCYPGSTSIAINPQIQLSRHPNRNRFEKITGFDLNCKDIHFRNELSDLIFKAKDSKFIFIENGFSEEDMAAISTVCCKYDKKVQYGIQKVCPNILIWTYDANCVPFHDAQEWPAMFFAIEYLYENFV